ncbi:DUF2480 family protein [Fulvivirga sp.]|uniref:DUF2480 family protein n=1 Tax=Fulvivirga sp. TaxID=1931237 RepID=UPI0032F092DF
MEDQIINRVANSPLKTFDLEDHYHTGVRQVLDIAPWLFNGIILKEKDFRSFVKEHNWADYEGKNVAIMCSVDAIIPNWAYMLVAINLEPYANMLVYGDLSDLENALFMQALAKVNLEDFQDAKIVVKGCGNHPVPEFAYVEITRLLRPIAASIMFGEPCSTVPLYKLKKR